MPIVPLPISHKDSLLLNKQGENIQQILYTVQQVLK